ncbi:MAG: radical SAM protein [Lachnospiraceae bacterium]|nr:radical SAM protein [Lachnospiraceae bacterium]
MENLQDKIYELSIKNKNLRSAIIELNSLCNWKCKHCYLGETKCTSLNKDTIVDIFKELRQLGVYELTLTGGEIFSRNDIFEVIELACNMCFKVNLFSNISLLNSKKINRLKELNISLISCTVFSMKEEVHDFITGVKGSLKKVIENISLLKESNIDIEVKTIVTKYNYMDYISVMEYVKENKLRFRIDYDIVPKYGENEKNDCRLTMKQFEEIINKLDNIKRQDFLKHNKEDYLCPESRNNIAIDSKGNVKPCIKYEYSVGNVFDNTIREIWENSLELKRIQELKWMDMGSCIKCEKNRFCNRCPLTNVKENKIQIDSREDVECVLANIRENIYVRIDKVEKIHL